MFSFTFYLVQRPGVLSVFSPRFFYSINIHYFCSAATTNGPLKINMQSKVKFDLNGQREAVISAEITYSEDVRDKVAKCFIEGLGFESNLAFISIERVGEMEQTPPNGMNESPTTRIEIKTFLADKDGTQRLCQSICNYQLEMLVKVGGEILKSRKEQA